MNERIWLGNLVRVDSNVPRYLYRKTNKHIDFRTMKDKIDLGWYDIEKNTLYLNKDYKNQFKAIKRQIIKDYHPKDIVDYFNLEGVI